MSSRSTIAAIRYGYGFAPNEVSPTSVTELIAQFDRQRAPDMRAGFALLPSLDFLLEFRRARRAAKKEVNQNGQVKINRRKMIKFQAEVLRLRVMDALAPQAGFLERMVGFWADHFSVSAQKSLPSRLLAGVFVEEAIRGNVATSFPQMLKAVVQHPAMLEYLDQNTSVGPASRMGRRRDKGLNENLARELLELHTLGVSSAYTQKDVRQLAELLTGLTFRKSGTVYKSFMAEPGSEQVMGKSYGKRGERLDNILEFLDDVARHPDTARHIAQKLVVHFVSDPPDAAHVAQIADVFHKTEGDFISVYVALLDHPNAWAPLGGKVKQPFEYLISGLRSFGVTDQDMVNLPVKELRSLIATPLALMGQKFMQPLGPDGWLEDAVHWITPQGLAGRIQWANYAVTKYGQGLDPRDYVVDSLRDFAGRDVVLAATRAEIRTEGLALVLASPDFNRR